MLAPHELKNKSFTKSIKGYNPTEVDDHIEFLIEKYTELYREYNELNKKLRVVATRLDEIKGEEASIRSTLVNAQKMSEKIIRDANDKADLITGAIKERCDAVIADFKQRMVKEKEEMWAIRTAVLDFKQDVFDLYRKHIEELQGINVNSLEEIVLPNENAIVESIIGDVTEAVKSDTAIAKAETESKELNPKKEEAEEKKVVTVDEAAAVKATEATVEKSGVKADEDDGDFFIKSLQSVKDDEDDD